MKGRLLPVLCTLLTCKHKHDIRGPMPFYSDCINICLVFAGLRPGCRLECRDWEVDKLRAVCKVHYSNCSVLSQRLYNMNHTGHVHLLFNHDIVRPLDIQTIRGESTDDSQPALTAYKHVLGYPCGISSRSITDRAHRFRASVMIILKNTNTAALHTEQLFGCSCPISRYKASMKHMGDFALKASDLMSAARLGDYVVHGFACNDS
jgi:hypothetical protein